MRTAVGRAGGFDDPAAGLQERADALGAPRSLGALGLPLSAVDDVARLVLERPIAHPRAVTPSEVQDLLGRAIRGDRVG